MNKLLSSSATTFLATVVLLLSSCSPKPGIKAPFSDLDPSSMVFGLDAGRDTTLTLSSGTVITYSGGTLVDASGDPVNGRFDLEYREFHDAVDIFLSGIPMTIETASGPGTLQTAGMFEIDARQQGKPLRIAEGRSIGIKFGSRYAEDDYNLYYMDPSEATWTEIGKPENSVNEEKKKFSDSLENNKPVKTTGPELIVFDYAQLLDIYFKDDWNSIWQHRTSNNPPPKALLEYGFTRYDDISIWQEVKFNNGSYLVNELVWRDLDRTGFPKWMNGYATEWDNREENGKYVYVPRNITVKPIGKNMHEFNFTWKGKRFTKRMEAIVPLRNLLKEPASKWSDMYQRAMDDMEKEQERLALMADTFREFEVRNLGIYNCDRLLQNPDWYEIDPVIVMEKPGEDFEHIVLLMGDNSAMVKIPAEQTMRINPASGHRIFIPLSNNEAEILTPEALAGLPKTKPAGETAPAMELKMKRIRFRDQAEFRAFLGF